MDKVVFFTIRNTLHQTTFKILKKSSYFRFFYFLNNIYVPESHMKLNNLLNLLAFPTCEQVHEWHVGWSNLQCHPKYIQRISWEYK